MPYAPHRRPRVRTALLGIVSLLLLVLSGCSPNSPQYILNADNKLAQMQSGLFIPIIVMAIIVFIVVEGMLVVALFRFRERPGGAIPTQLHGNTRLEIAWTIAPTLVLAAIAVPTVITIFTAATIPTGPDVINVRVVGHQWWWEFDYPELGIVTANEPHFPVGKTVAFQITSADVIHSFWIPRLGGKRDAIPGHVNEIWYGIDKPGYYYGQCVEYCGTSHANMRIRAIVESPEEFDAWAKRMASPITPPTTGDAAVGAGLFRSRCISCHTIQGIPGAAGIIGPNLTHVGSRTTIGSGLYDNTPENLAKWIHDPKGMKPGNLMVVPGAPLKEDELFALAAFLTSLK